MTNSSPKNNKIERHNGAPNSHGKQKRSPNYIKTATYFANATNGNNLNNSPNLANSNVTNNNTNININNNNNNGGRNNKSPGGAGRQNGSPQPKHNSAKNVSRVSPVRHDSLRGSPTNGFYAGAKFSEPPSPSSLPKPPSHWTGLMLGCRQEIATMTPCHVSQNIKMMINVQA